MKAHTWEPPEFETIEGASSVCPFTYTQGLHEVYGEADFVQ